MRSSILSLIMGRTMKNLLPSPAARVRATVIARPASDASRRQRGGDSGQGESKDDELTPKQQDLLIKVLRPVFPPPALSERERARRRKLMIAYGRLQRAIFLETERRANRFLLAKWTAIDALPQSRREEALEHREDLSLLKFPIWTHTPPIPNFDVGDLTKRSKEQRKSNL